MAGEGGTAGEVSGCAGIEANLASVMDRVGRAARRSGREPRDVTVVAVTKTVPVEGIMEAVRLGITDIGENRVQEARGKYAAIGGQVKWHMIGHLQSNKAKIALEMFDIIHSLDTLSLARELCRLAAVRGKPARTLVQVNVSGEESKFGLPPAELPAFLRAVSEMGNVRVEGLMTIAPFVDDPELARPHFRRLKGLFEAAARVPLPGVEMRYLSMGMTNDFEVAIEEGANVVRLGTAIFGPRPAR
ncbi:MAG: YggS family pyridoxal phosphate-dependent enzyme [Ignavibacteriales bacterium]